MRRGSIAGRKGEGRTEHVPGCPELALFTVLHERG